MSSRAPAYGVRPPGFVGNRVAEWAPFTGSNAGTMFGWLLNTTPAATVQTPALANSNFRTAIRHTEFKCGGGAQRAAGLVSSAAACWRGNGARLGGFCYGVRFALSSAAKRAFIGLSASSTPLVSSVEPSAVANSIGVGFDSNHSTWRVFRQSAAAGTVEDTGLSRNTAEVFDLTISCGPNASEIHVRFVELSTGALVFERALTTTLPANNALLFAHAYVGNATDSPGLYTLDLVSMFLEVPDAAYASTAPVLGREGIFDVRDFGARGDGVTNDHPAFRSALAAMDALGGFGGATLYVPPRSLLPERRSRHRPPDRHEGCIGRARRGVGPA